MSCFHFGQLPRPPAALHMLSAAAAVVPLYALGRSSTECVLSWQMDCSSNPGTPFIIVVYSRFLRSSISFLSLSFSLAHSSPPECLSLSVVVPYVLSCFIHWGCCDNLYIRTPRRLQDHFCDERVQVNK